MATIAMPTVDLGGHIQPANRFATVLVRHGHRVLTWAPERWRPTVEASGAEFRRLEAVSGVRPHGSSVAFAAMLASACDTCIDGLIAELAEVGPDVVVHDAHALWGRVAAEFLGLPRIVTNPVIPSSADDQAASWSARDAARSSGLDRDGTRDIHARELERCRLSIGRRWGVELGNDHATNFSPGEVTVTFTTPEMLGDWTPPADWWLAGPLMGEVSGDRARFERPLIYVSLGTLFVSAGALATVIDALGAIDAQVVIDVAHPAVTTAELGPLADHITVQRNADQRRLLARASLFITHAGIGSVHESLIAGVPMICLPQGADQFAWAERISALGAGETAPATAPAISQAVERVRHDDAYRRRAAEIGRRLLEYPGEAVVVAALSAAGIHSP